jgi:hypothetical protein
MTIVKRKVLKDGPRHLTIAVSDEDSIVHISNTGFYMLGAQLDMVVPAAAIADCIQVYWCPIAQKWMDA